MTFHKTFGLALAAVVIACSAHAKTPPIKALRLIGEAPTAADPIPKHFVVDLTVAPGDGDSQTSLSGWLASIEAPAASGQVMGTCVQQHCAITAELDGGKVSITGDFGEAKGPVAAHFNVKDEDGKASQQGAVQLAPMESVVPGLGALAAPDAVTDNQLDDLLMWGGRSVAAGKSFDEDLLDDIQRGDLSEWQDAKGRLATGLIFASDIAELKADAVAAQKTAGWTPLGDAAKGWSAGYPAALLPVKSGSGGEHRFASANGKAAVVIAVDPPMTEDAFDAFVEKTTGDREGRSQLDSTRANGDLNIRYEEGGVVTAAAYRHRDGAFVRVVFTYPADQSDAWKMYEVILQRSLDVSDDVKP